jgi:hypothetical protein
MKKIELNTEEQLETLNEVRILLKKHLADERLPPSTRKNKSHGLLESILFFSSVTKKELAILFLTELIKKNEIPFKISYIYTRNDWIKITIDYRKFIMIHKK